MTCPHIIELPCVLELQPSCEPSCSLCKLDLERREAAKLREQVHELTGRVRNMTSAASSAAASTVIAIERIEQMDKIVKAAQAWRELYIKPIRDLPAQEYLRRQLALSGEVEKYTELEKKRS